MKFKGPVFPSYVNANPNPGPAKTWIPHQNRRERIRNLKKACRYALDSKDPNDIAAGLRILKMVKEEPDPEFSSLHLFAAAATMAQETKAPWATCMNLIADKFEKRAVDGETIPQDGVGKQGTSEAGPEARPESPSYVGRLLRGLVPRSLRKGHEGSATVNIHQHPGDVDGQREAGQGRHPTKGARSYFR